MWLQSLNQHRIFTWQLEGGAERRRGVNILETNHRGSGARSRERSLQRPVQTREWSSTRVLVQVVTRERCRAIKRYVQAGTSTLLSGVLPFYSVVVSGKWCVYSSMLMHFLFCILNGFFSSSESITLSSYSYFAHYFVFFTWAVLLYTDLFLTSQVYHSPKHTCKVAPTHKHTQTHPMSCKQTGCPVYLQAGQL